MARMVWLIGLFVVLSFPVSAEVKPAATLDAEICKYLTLHVAEEGVEYQPGVDVHGKPVVEADLNAPVVTLPDHFSFDITVDVAQQAGIAVPVGTEGQMKVGTVRFAQGKFFFNDRPLEGEEEAGLRAMCGQKPADLPKDGKN